MESTRTRRFVRRLSAILLPVALVLFLLWLALPRLLGLAAERWLDIPGLQALHVEIEQVGTARAHLRELRAAYQSPGGDRVQFALHDISLDYSLTDRHVEQLQIARGELTIFLGTASDASPWPQLLLPKLPLQEARIDQLRMSIQLAQRAPVELQGKVHFWHTGDTVALEFEPDGNHLRLTATPLPETSQLELQANWQLATGPTASALLLIGKQPAQQPARLSAEAPLPLLLDLARQLNLSVPLNTSRGSISLSAEAQLGETAGSLHSIRGEATFAATGGQTTIAASTLDVALTGKLKFAWQPSAIQIDLQPGLNWQLTTEEEHALRARGQIIKQASIHLEEKSLYNEGDFPFSLFSTNLGQWDGALQQLKLQRTDDLTPWNAADAKLHVKGQLKTWQQDRLRINNLQAAGDLAVNWSAAGGLRGKLSTQANIGRLSQTVQTGDSSLARPNTIANSSWQLNTQATARSGENLWNSLTLQGEADASQLKLEPTTGSPLMLGPTHIKLMPFRPSTLPSGKIEAQVTAKAIRYGTWPSPDLKTQLQLANGKIRADGSLLLQGTEVLQFAASHTLASTCGETDLTVQQALPMLSRLLQPRPAALLPLELPVGDADARLTLKWCAQPSPQMSAQGTLNLRNTTLGWDKARIEALRATIRLEGLQPLQGRVQLSAARGELATGTNLTDLNLDIALLPQELAVHAFDLKLLGGGLHGEPTRLPWPLTEHTLALELRQIDLEQLLALFEVDGLSGSGQLNGVLPLTYRDGSLEIDNGLLNSPGAGTLKYAPAQSLPDNPGLLALRNFHFKQLRTHLWYAADGTYRTQIKLDGNNPDFYNGYPIRFGLNVNGALPGVFRSAIFSGDFNRHILEQLQSGKLQ